MQRWFHSRKFLRWFRSRKFQESCGHIGTVGVGIGSAISSLGTVGAFSVIYLLAHGFRLLGTRKRDRRRVEEVVLRAAYLHFFGRVSGYRLSILQQPNYNSEFIVPTCQWQLGDESDWSSQARFRKGYFISGLAWERPLEIFQWPTEGKFGPFDSRKAFENYHTKELKFAQKDASRISNSMQEIRSILCIGLVDGSDRFLGVLSIDSWVTDSISEVITSEELFTWMAVISSSLET